MTSASFVKSQRMSLGTNLPVRQWRALRGDEVGSGHRALCLGLGSVAGAYVTSGTQGSAGNVGCRWRDLRRERCRDWEVRHQEG
jgi:hypothetical protein